MRPLLSCLTTRIVPTSPRVIDVEAAVGLEVESLDVDGANLLNGLGDEVDLGADEVGDGEGLFTRVNGDVDGPLGGDLFVDRRARPRGRSRPTCSPARSPCAP